MRPIETFMKLFKYTEYDDPNESFIVSQRNEFRRQSVFLLVVPASIGCFGAALFNFFNGSLPEWNLVIPELLAGLYLLCLAIYYRFNAFKQNSALVLFLPAFIFWIFLFGNTSVHFSVIALLPIGPLLCYFLYERRLAFLLSIVVITSGGLSYVSTIEPDGEWILGRAKYNLIFGGIVIIWSLNLYTGLQRKVENKLLQLANTDALTHLGNRHYFSSRSMAELSKATRESHPLSLIMIDIDNFKKVNDKWGHDCGDKALELISDTLLDSARETDVCFRMGGEEFLILVPESNVEDTSILAERIRQAIESATLEWKGKPLKFTASFGIATLNVHGGNMDDLVEAADKALYKAKESGRNCIVVA
jgi:diguanylate cyclase (GGDEF)-like protein